MKRAFILRSLFAAVLALLIAGIISVFAMQSQYREERKAEMRLLLNAVTASQNTDEDTARAKTIASFSEEPIRVTFIAADGTVLGDSDADAASMENHKGRDEVKSALETGYGEEVRYSSTLGSNMLYTAKRLNDGTVVRLSATLKSINDHVWSLFPALLIGVFAALAVASLFAWKMADGAVRPMIAVAESLENINAGGYGIALAEPKYSELVPMIRQINLLSDKIAGTLAELTAERKQIRFLLDNMNEGLVVLDHSQKILLINRSACTCFGAPEKPVGKNLLLLTRNPHIAESVENAALKKASDFFDMDSPDGASILQIFINPVSGGETESEGGVVILITDVTDARRSEQIRTEFVANASHELKTPLTSIKGFSELLASGMVSNPEKTEEYLSLIHSETDRMISLINDILRLSELESISEDSGKSSVSLLAVAEEVKRSLAPQAAEKNVSVSVNGADGILEANRDRMMELELNLIDNAIKYNRDGGKVDIMISERKDAVVFYVRDTGIGIPPEARERVFERFYRVDKSRSRKIGGTGLGLSIVKHIVELYHGKIKLKSVQGEGTEISVILPVSSGRFNQPDGYEA